MSSFYGQDSLKKDSLPGRTLIFETWCYTRKKVKEPRHQGKSWYRLGGDKYIEKEWKICDHATERQARDHVDILQRRNGWGLSSPNMVGRRYFVKVISK